MKNFPGKVVFLAGLSCAILSFASGTFGAEPFRTGNLPSAALQEEMLTGKCVSGYYAGNHVETMNACHKAAERGNSWAQYYLGAMYDDGMGTGEDDVKAATWYRKAAEQGNAKAQFSLGMMYRTGEGVLQDDAEAVRWYRRSAEQGNAKAQNDLGAMYKYGAGVLQDHVTAHMWFNIATVNGNRLARKNRDFVARQLYAGALMGAQERAKRCLASGYRECD